MKYSNQKSSPNSLGRLFVAAGIAEFMLVAIIVSPIELDDRALTALTLPPPIQNISSPAHIRVPSVGIAALLEPLGLTPQGSIESPVMPESVGWYELGPRPGMPGNAVIVGHSGWKDGIGAAFDRLKDIRQGDRIFIEERDGGTQVFIVDEWRYLAQDEETSSIFVTNDTSARISLITCSGDWDGATNSYARRLIVSATKAD